MRSTWDIFCLVVDNYGDIGVTWRLARQLVKDHQQQVRLWVDDLDSFFRLCPEITALEEVNPRYGVTVMMWPTTWEPVAVADVVIEAFACQLPNAYIEAMTQRSCQPLWLNLDYLSAENWVEGCHGLPSLQPNGLQKFFFFPGFTSVTGGLLREANLLNERRRFQLDACARADFLQSINVTPVADAWLISLFAYENAALSSWLNALSNAEQLTHLIVPEGRIVSDIKCWIQHELCIGDIVTRGALTIQIIPFVDQDNYDRLLWSCDFNAVRGEDSFVRAQWSGRPLLWHIYKQPENVHLDKLNAFLVRYTEGLNFSAKNAVLNFWQEWNKGEDVTSSWQAMLNTWPELTEHAEKWCFHLSTHTNLASALAEFYQDWVSCAVH